MEFTQEANRIYAEDNDGTLLAEILFPSTPEGDYVITHTFVSQKLRGQGIAAELVATAAKQIEAAGKKVTPKCGYAVKWFGDHPEYAGLLK